jgi:hypothetical protein
MGTDAIGSLTQRGDGEKCQHVISTYIDSIKTYQDNPRHCISKRLKKGFIRFLSFGSLLLEWALSGYMQLAKRRSVDKPVKKCPSHLLKRGHKLDAGSQPVPTRVLMENQQSEHIRTIEMNSDELM